MESFTNNMSSRHTFMPRKPTDSRSPCPALNALANHDYLPRNGRDITLFQLTYAVHNVYNVSYPLSIILSIVGILLCGNGLTIDLEQLGKHNLIEHDASLVHKDCIPGQSIAPNSVDQTLLQKLLRRAAPSHGLTLKDFVRVRAERESMITKPLNAWSEQIAVGETSLTLLVMGNHGKVPTSVVSQWFGDEKIPDGWRRPSHTVGLLTVQGLTDKIKRLKSVWHMAVVPFI